MDRQNHRADVQPDDQHAQHAQRKTERAVERVTGLARTAGVKTEKDFDDWVASNDIRPEQFGLPSPPVEVAPEPEPKATSKPRARKSRAKKPAAKK